MTRYYYLILLWCIGFSQGFSQSIYPGPQPETLATTDVEKTFLAAFRTTFASTFDTPAQYTKRAATGLDAWEMSLFDAPRYLLISKKGSVADENAKRPSQTDAILQDILMLMAE